MGATALGLHPHVEIAGLEVPVELRPDRFDVAVVAGGFHQSAGLLVNQSRTGWLTSAEAALPFQRLTPQQLLQQGFPLTYRNHRAPGQQGSQLLIEDAGGTTPQNRLGLGVIAARAP